MEKILKYPRTRHLEGSRLQKGDEDLSQVPFSSIKGKYIVVEEKVDGANVAISFNDKGELLLQSRGHYLIGGYRERHYNLFKQWAAIHKDSIYGVIKDRYIIFGEWMYAKHSIYYDSLPHYFLEFDVYDKDRNVFLDTKNRKELLKDLPIESVPVLGEGKFDSLQQVLNLITNSNYISDNYEKNYLEELDKQDVEIALNPIQDSKLMEGLYIKVEENGCVIDRMKYVRYSFAQTLIDSDKEWINRKIIPNKLSKNLSELF